MNNLELETGITWILTNLRNWDDWDGKHYPLSQGEAEIVSSALIKMKPTEPIEKEVPYDEANYPKLTNTKADTAIVHLCPNKECRKELPSYPNNGRYFNFQPKYCAHCGQAIKWEGEE